LVYGTVGVIQTTDDSGRAEIAGFDDIIDVVLEFRREVEALRVQLGQPPKTPQNSFIR
jgi:hypothetical protein